MLLSCIFKIVHDHALVIWVSDFESELYVKKKFKKEVLTMLLENFNTDNVLAKLMITAEMKALSLFNAVSGIYNTFLQTWQVVVSS